MRIPQGIQLLVEEDFSTVQGILKDSSRNEYLNYKYYTKNIQGVLLSIQGFYKDPRGALLEYSEGLLLLNIGEKKVTASRIEPLESHT